MPSESGINPPSIEGNGPLKKITKRVKKSVRIEPNPVNKSPIKSE